jgi:LuxR family maltose regulon positive regulatory protein
MLLSAWARPRQRSVGWVSLDSSDNDPAQFWTYVLLHLLQSAQPASIETVLAVLINALGTLQQHIALILDDYHVIEELPIHRTVTFLLDHLPLQFPLVLASRVDPPLPLVRLHARYQLVELRADDLRFIFAEAASFLNEIMGFQLAEHGSASESSARAFGAQPD